MLSFLKGKNKSQPKVPRALIRALKGLFNENENLTRNFIIEHNITINKYENAASNAIMSGKNLKNILSGKVVNNEPNNIEIPIPNNILPNRNMTDMVVETNLHNYDSTQCYRNSILHLLLSIIQNELISDKYRINKYRNRNKNENDNTVEMIYDSLFNLAENRNNRKNNLKRFLLSMLMKRRPVYTNIFTTYYNISKMNNNPNTAVNDCVQYLLSILPALFSPRLNSLISIPFQSIPNYRNFEVSLGIDGGTNLRSIDLINYIRSNRLINTYIIIPINFFNTTTSNIDINLNEIIVVHPFRYKITDIIYYGSGHYVSLNERNDTFYLYNDLDNRVVPENQTNGNPLKRRILTPLSITPTSEKKNIVLNTGSISHLTSTRVYGYDFSDFRPRLIMLQQY